MPDSTALVLLSDWQDSQVEFWRRTQYLGYDVSSLGRVRSWRSNPAPRLLKASPSVRGYPRVAIGKYKYVYVHQLVAQAFISNTAELSTVNHKTLLKTDNRVDGLEWVSQQANNQHAVDNLRLSNEFRIVLTDITAHAARLMKRSGLPQWRIAKHLGVCQMTISNLFSGKLRKFFPDYAEK